jgi:hypothetical protein
VHVQTHEGGTFLHDRLLSYAALVPPCEVHYYSEQ